MLVGSDWGSDRFEGAAVQGDMCCAVYIGNAILRRCLENPSDVYRSGAKY
jgi:hypothetical protein